MMQHPSKLRGARGGRERAPLTATTMTTQSPGCPSKLLFVAAVTAAKSASARPFSRRRGLGTTPPPPEAPAVTLSSPVFFIFEENAGAGCGDPAALLALLRGLITPTAGEITTVPPVRSAPNARRPERPDREGEGVCFVPARIRPRAPTVRSGESGGVVPDEAPALGVDDAGCDGGGARGFPLCRGVVVAPKWSSDSPGGCGGGVNRAKTRGHLTIDPGRMVQPWASIIHGGMRSRWQVEHTFPKTQSREREGPTN